MLRCWAGSSRPTTRIADPVMIKHHAFGYPTPFVGRAKELVDITTRLLDPDCRLLSLTGLGGSGKTRLAIQAATTLASDFPHGTVFVGLQSLTQSDLLVHTIAQALGLTLYGEHEPETQLFNHLREKSLLLLLDNFEHLLSGTALISTILAHAPRVKILVTSREALNVQEEWLYPIKGMSIPLSAYARSLEDYEAVQLFLYHARRIQPNFELANERESVIRICEMTAGLPLAIELAASWLKGLAASQIAFQMQHNLDFLSTTTRNVEERHRSIRAVFDQSWELLPENERVIFAGISVFRGGFDTGAAEQVAGASLSILAALVEKSLLQMDASGRFSIHELLRQYGLERLEAYGATEATYARHSHYFAQLMLGHETALKQPQQLETLQAIERDFENIRLAWEWLVTNQQATYLHMMLNGLYLFGFLGSRHLEIITIFQQTLARPVADAPLMGRLLARRWGFLHWWYQPDYQEALTKIEQALAIALAEDNRFEIAFCHLMAAYTLMSMQRYTEALPHVETSKALFEALGEPYYVCWALNRLGYLYANLNQPDKEIEYTEQSLALARATHNRFALVICLYNLGSDYILNGDYITGKQYGAEALQFAAETGHPCQTAHVLSLLALHAFCQGDYTTCQSYADRSQVIIDDISLLVIQPYSLSLLILLACLHEEYAEGVRLSGLAQRHSTNTMGFQLHYWALAALSCGLGRVADARVAIQNVLQLTDPIVHAATTIWIVPCAAYTLATTDPAKAVELLAWVFSYPDTALNWARRWPLVDRLRAQLLAMMDGDVYQTHWDKGKAHSFDGIASYLHQAFRAASDAGADAPYQHLLTAREREILGLMAAGMTNPQIAAQLVIGAGTVKTHTLNIYRKLEVANRTQAIVRAQ
jgi:predicted ATPase/DNA-binding CsgD family transcriptional regulator